MKKLYAILLALFLTVTLVCCTTTGGNGSDSSTASESPAQESPANEPADAGAEQDGETVVIGVAQCTTQEERWRNDGKALQQVADSLGIQLNMLDAANDPATQATQIENLVTSGVDALLISPTDAEAILSAIADAKAAGIPVVVWGRQVDSPEQDFFIINNFRDVGLQMGQTALEVCPEGDYVLIGGDKSTSVPTEMTEGIMEALQPAIDAGKINLVFEQYITNWMPEGAMSAMENALTQTGNKVDMVICHNDGMAGGAIQALAGQGMDKKVPVIGMDAEIAALQRIAEGVQYSTVLFDHAGFAEVGMNAAYQLAKGDPIDSYITKTTTVAGAEIATGDIPIQVITAENMKQIIIDSGLQSMEDVYKNVPKADWPQ